MLPFHTISLIWSIAMLLAAGCVPTPSLFEREDIVSILQSNVSDYMLIVYRRPDGVERHELWRGGVWELSIEKRGGTAFVLKERGRQPQRLEPAMVEVLQARIDALLYGRPPERFDAAPLTEI